MTFVGQGPILYEDSGEYHLKQRSNPLSWITVDNAELSVDEFPDGSFRFTVVSDEPYSSVVSPTFVVRLETTLPEAIIAAYQVCSALIDSYDECFIDVIVQTMPDQRADRREQPGMSNPAFVTANLIGNLPCNRLIVYDLHSFVCRITLQDVCEADGKELIINEPLECFLEALNDLDPATSIDYVVAVDKGAVARAESVAAYYGAKVIYCDKKRVDGKVVGHKFVQQPGVHVATGNLGNKNVWVIDDLCDGGATFISVAKLLRKHYSFNELNLYVTHGLFSKGKEELFQHYTTILALFDYSN